MKDKTPAELRPEDSDEVIFATMTAPSDRPFVPPLVETKVIDGVNHAWSRQQQRWLSTSEYAAEWRNRYRYRQIMGSEEETLALNKYEKGMGL